MPPQNRRQRSWREVEAIVGAGVYKLPEFFRNGLYSLIRAGLPDAEIVCAYQRCRSWTAKARKSGIGECECCGTRLPMNKVNAQKVSVWNLDAIVKLAMETASVNGRMRNTSNHTRRGCGSITARSYAAMNFKLLEQLNKKGATDKQ